MTDPRPSDSGVPRSLHVADPQRHHELAARAALPVVPSDERLTDEKRAITIKNAHTIADFVHRSDGGPIEALHAAIDMLAAAGEPDRRVMSVVEAAKAWHEANVDNDVESLTAELKLHEALQHLKGEQP